MPDTTKPRHTAKICSECAGIMKAEALFLAHPFTVDSGGGMVLLPEQPPQEKVDELTRDAEALARFEGFEAKVAAAAPKG